jgi:Fur family peroxide stress response transcriptional regulator
VILTPLFLNEVIESALSPDFPNISVATIYNNLRVFKDIGIVKELPYGDSIR